LALFYGLKAAGLLRVSAEEELAGLDISEHGMYAYPQPQVALETFGGGTPLGSALGAGALVPAKSHAVEAL
jgi:Amt family ammonium transporter